MVYALDTNIIIHYLKKTQNVHLNFNAALLRGDKFIIPNIVNYEIKRGFRISSTPKKELAYKILTEQDEFCDVAEMDSFCWERAEQVYANLYQKRLTVGELDMLIAAFCLENNYIFVTNNVKDFQNISGLTIEDWTKN